MRSDLLSRVYGASTSNIANSSLVADSFNADKTNYIIEHVRLDPPVEMVSFINDAGEQSAFSLTAANRDPLVFKDALKFNPSRRDLNKSLSWNALGEHLGGIAGESSSLTRVCPAFEYSVRMTEALVSEMLPVDEDMPILCHRLYHWHIFYFFVLLNDGLGALLSLFYIFFGFYCASLRFRLRVHCESEIEELVRRDESEGSTTSVVHPMNEPAPKPMPSFLRGISSRLREGPSASRESLGVGGSARKRRISSVYASAISQKGAGLELKDVNATVSRFAGERVLLNSINLR